MNNSTYFDGTAPNDDDLKDVLANFCEAFSGDAVDAGQGVA